MKYTPEIQSASSNPEQLEDLYQTSRASGVEAEFRSDLNTLYAQAPDNLLLAAWYYRFLRSPLVKAARRIPWALAVLLGLGAGLVIWLISDPELLIHDSLPAFVLFWSPVATIFCLLFLAIVSRKNAWNYVLPGLILAIASGYVLLANHLQLKWVAENYLIQMALHLTLLSWICLGLAVTGWRSSAYNRFAFLTKSVEVAVAAGLLLIFGVFLGFLTMILFTTLEVDFPESLMRLVALGGIGLLSILSVAMLYDPGVPPEAQDFSQGLSKFIVMIMRLLLPAALLILVMYIFFIPFNFMAPFNQREVLILFNIVLFAILGLLIGATPLHTDDLSPRLQRVLRAGITTLAGLAALVSLYALAAIVYRSSDGMTMNRLTVIGWNVINLGIFVSIVFLQLRRGVQDWAGRLHLVFNRAIPFYALWCVLVILAIPLLYR